MIESLNIISEAERLENLWSNTFGDAYVARNWNAGETRGAFWQEVLTEFPVERVLEVGCNIGANLRWVASHIPNRDIYGVDINQKALGELHTRLPDINAVWSSSRALPFRDNWFDLVFTMGVLIHQPPEMLSAVMSEIVRCSRRYVLCGEYYAQELTEVPYRGQEGALFKQDFGGLYQQQFPGLKLLQQGFLSQKEGWDDVTYWIFEKA